MGFVLTEKDKRETLDAVHLMQEKHNRRIKERIRDNGSKQHTYIKAGKKIHPGGVLRVYLSHPSCQHL